MSTVSFAPNYKTFLEYPSALVEANKTYKQITNNYHHHALYPKVNKPSNEDYGACACEYQPGDPIDDACGSECINRILFIECTGDCPIGDYCQNKRFQKAEYVVIDVFKTESKGYGLRAMAPIKKNTFIMEYIGEIIPKDVFYQRQTDYAKKGIQHFYFMSLPNGELIDATERGNIARFMNHSCNPNCCVQKWTVNKRTRIGIFALRDIVLGEELTFDYNMDRKGMAAQKCHCGEDNCRKYLGGQKGYEILDDNEEIQDAEDVPEFIRAMIRTLHNRDEVLKMLHCLKVIDDNDVFSKFKHLHGLLVLKAYLVEWRQDDEIVLKTLEVLPKLPIMARNTIDDAKIEEKMEIFKERSPQMKELVDALFEKWESLIFLHRCPKKTKEELEQEQKLIEEEEARKAKELEEEKQKEAEKRKLKDKEAQARRKSSYNNSSHEFSGAHAYYTPYQVDRNFRAYKNGPERRLRYESGPSSMNDSCQASASTSTDRYRPTPQLVARHQQRSPNKAVTQSTLITPTQPTSLFPDLTSLPQVPKLIQPGSLHPNWCELVGDEGQIYYYNFITKKRQWDRPVVENRQTLEGCSVTSINAVIERAMASQHVAVESVPRGEESGAKEEPAAVTSEVEFKEKLQNLVIDRCSRWKGEFKAAEFKKHARRLAHLVIEKEFRRQKEGAYVVTDSLRLRIKEFVGDYISKLLKHRREPLETTAFSGKKRSLEDRSVEGGHHKKSKN